MVEEINLIIFVLLIIVLMVIDSLEPMVVKHGRSELHACHRYAVAEQIMSQRSITW